MNLGKALSDLKTELETCSQKELLQSSLRLARTLKELKKQKDELADENIELEDERSFLLESIAEIHRSVSHLDFGRNKPPTSENDIMAYVTQVFREDSRRRSGVTVSPHVGELGPVRNPDNMGSAIFSSLASVPGVIGGALSTFTQSGTDFFYNSSRRQRFRPDTSGLAFARRPPADSASPTKTKRGIRHGRVHKRAPDALCGAFSNSDNGPIITVEDEAERPNAGCLSSFSFSHPSASTHPDEGDVASVESSSWITPAERAKLQRNEVPDLDTYGEATTNSNTERRKDRGGRPKKRTSSNSSPGIDLESWEFVGSEKKESPSKQSAKSAESPKKKGEASPNHLDRGPDSKKSESIAQKVLAKREKEQEKKKEFHDPMVVVTLDKSSSAKLLVAATIELTDGRLAQLQLRALDKAEDLVFLFVNQLGLDLDVVQPVELWMSEIEAASDSYPIKCAQKLEYIIKTYSFKN
eukprot:Platyproteum_vivax@DN6119_c0_g1_i2.p1